MPDRLDTLRANLRELEAELAAGKELDSQTKNSLAEIAEEIRAILHQNEPDSAVPPSLLERLQQEERSFEASHPQLTQALARIIDALGQIGI